MPTAKKQTPKQAAFTFFLTHAGYSYDPKTETPKQGRARCARQLAKAERDARARGFTFNWDLDPEGCTGCDCGSSDCACSTAEDHETLWCWVEDENGKTLASLGSICGVDHDYRRVVEAELALEALAERAA